MNCACCRKPITGGGVLVNGSYYCSKTCVDNQNKYKGKYDIGTGLKQTGSGIVGMMTGDGGAGVDAVIYGGSKIALGLGAAAVTGLIAGGKHLAKKSREAKEAEEQRVIKEAQQARILKAKFEALKSNRKAQTTAVNSNATEFIFCGDCGVKNDPGDLYCSDCGEKLT